MKPSCQVHSTRFTPEFSVRLYLPPGERELNRKYENCNVKNWCFHVNLNFHENTMLWFVVLHSSSGFVVSTSSLQNFQIKAIVSALNVNKHECNG